MLRVSVLECRTLHGRLEHSTEIIIERNLFTQAHGERRSSGPQYIYCGALAGIRHQSKTQTNW